MTLPLPQPRPLARRSSPSGGGRARLFDSYRGAGRQAQLPVSDDALARRNAIAQEHGLTDDPIDRHHAGRHCVVGSDHPRDHALLRRKHGAGRRRQHAPLDLDRERNLHRETRPQQFVRVVGNQLDDDGARLFVDLVVDEADRAPHGRAPAARHHNFSRGLGGEGSPHGTKLALRYGKGDEDRFRLVDRDQSRRFLRPDGSPQLGRETARAARDRRANGEIVELRLLRVQQRPPGRDAGFQPLDGIARLVERSLRDDLLADQRLAAGERGLGVAETCLILGDVGLGLRDLRLHHAIVEAEQDAAFPNHIALAEGNLHDLSVDARLDGDGGQRLDRARRRQNDRHVGFLDHGRSHGCSAGGSPFASPLFGRSLGRIQCGWAGGRRQPKKIGRAGKYSRATRQQR